MALQAAPKWEPFLDDAGNLYFYSHESGESVWELPDEDNNPKERAPLTSTVKTSSGHGTGSTKKELNPFAVAVGVVDAVVELVDEVESNHVALPSRIFKKKFANPAAEARRAKNDLKAQKHKQRVHDQSAAKYLKIVLPPVTTATAAPGDEVNGNLCDQDEDARPRQVGDLFTAEESAQWLQNHNAEQIRARKALRKERAQHRSQVRALKKNQSLLLQFRSELTRLLLGDIKCSPELLKQRILLLSGTDLNDSAQDLEPEVAEKLVAAKQLAHQERCASIRNVFELLAVSKNGKLSMLRSLVGMFSNEQIQQHCGKIAGLQQIIESPRLQQFIVRFASLRHPDDELIPSDFEEFVDIVEVVWEYQARVQKAVRDAEDEIDAALEAAALVPGTSAVRTRMGLVSKKKVEQELAALQEKAEILRSITGAAQKNTRWLSGDSLIEPKAEWEKNHHHRWICRTDCPLYCCLCRRRQWELRRREIDECEREHRNNWLTTRELRLKEQELHLVDSSDDQKQNGSQQDVVSPLTLDRDTAVDQDQLISDHIKKCASMSDDEFAVAEVIQSIVTLIESMSAGDVARAPNVHKSRARVRRKQSPKRAAASRVHQAATSSSSLRCNIMEQEEQERRAMHDEEVAVRFAVERNLRVVERPLLRLQDTAHDAYLRIVGGCVEFSQRLAHLQFDRCLSFSSPHQFTLLMEDRTTERTTVDESRVVLHVTPSDSDSNSNFFLAQMRQMQQHLDNPFVAQLLAVDTRMFQFFADSGMIVECWPVQFTIVEYFPRGPWLVSYREMLTKGGNDTKAFVAVEQHVLAVFRDVAAGLAALHSLGVLHLNVRAEHIYLGSNDSNQGSNVKIGGLLAWTASYDGARLAEGDMLYSLDFNYAPPETLERRPITAKADVWMLGCSLCDVLLMWQHTQLAALASSRPAQQAPLLYASKSVPEILLQLPLAASSTVRSLIRMLLQPNPASRPDMSQVVEYITFSSANSGMRRFG